MGFWSRFTGGVQQGFGTGFERGSQGALQGVARAQAEQMQLAGEERQATREDERFQRNNQIAGIRSLGQRDPLAAAEQARTLGPEYGWLVQELEASGKTQAQQGLTDIRTQGATGVGLGQTTLAKAAALPPTQAVSALSQGLNETEQQRMQVQATTTAAATRSRDFNTLFEGAGQAAQIVDQQALIQQGLLDAGRRAQAERQLADFMTEVDKSDTPMTEEQARTLYDLKKGAGAPEDFARTFVSTKRQAQDERFVFSALRTDPAAARSAMRRIHAERGTINPVLLDLVETAASNDRSDAVFAQAYQMLGQGQYDLVLEMAPQVTDPQRRDLLTSAVTSLRTMSDAEVRDAQRADMQRLRSAWSVPAEREKYRDPNTGEMPSLWAVVDKLKEAYGPRPEAGEDLKNATAAQQADILTQRFQLELDQAPDKAQAAAAVRRNMEAHRVAPAVVERVLQVLGRDPRNGAVQDILIGTPGQRREQALYESGLVGYGLETAGQALSGLPDIGAAMRNPPPGLEQMVPGASVIPALFGRGKPYIPPATRGAVAR